MGRSVARQSLKDPAMKTCLASGTASSKRRARLGVAADGGASGILLFIRARRLKEARGPLVAAALAGRVFVFAAFPISGASAPGKENNTGQRQ